MAFPAICRWFSLFKHRGFYDFPASHMFDDRTVWLFILDAKGRMNKISQGGRWLPYVTILKSIEWTQWIHPHPRRKSVRRRSWIDWIDRRRAIVGSCVSVAGPASRFANVAMVKRSRSFPNDWGWKFRVPPKNPRSIFCFAWTMAMAAICEVY